MSLSPINSDTEIKYLYASLFDAMPGNSILLKTDAPRFTIVAATPGYQKHSEGKTEDLIGKGLFEVFISNPNDPLDTGEANLRASLDLVLQSREQHHLAVQRYDLKLEDRSYTKRYWRSSNSPVITSKGEVSHIIHTTEDITEQVVAAEMKDKMKGMEQANNMVEESERNLRNIILQAPVAMAILKGAEFVVELANDRMYELWGKGKEELLGKSIFVGLPEVRDQGYEELLKKVFTTGERFTAFGIPVMLPRNGSIETVYINLLYEAFTEVDGSISGVMAVATDVTAQEVARMKVEESHKEFQFVTDFIPQMIWVTRPDGYHYYYNKQWYDYTGLTYGQTEGEGWNHVFHPEDQPRAWELWRRSLQTGEPYEIEYRCRRFDGEYRWVLGRALPLKDATGKILKWFGTCTDIDDQKRGAEILEQKVEERTRELKNVNEQLKQFAYSASHDLQEPLRKIQVFLSRLRKNLELNEENKKITERIFDTTQRMRSLIDDLLDYSNTTLGFTSFKVVSLAEVVQEVLDDMEVTIMEEAAEVEYDGLPEIKGDRHQLRQLFQNLISNGIKYHKKNVVPTVVISAQLIHGKDIEGRIPLQFKNRRYYLIEVKDNGIGFDSQYADEIFILFKRLHGKVEYKGTGVGLAIVQKVVDNHHGYIWVESEPGVGSTFRVLLPIE